MCAATLNLCIHLSCGGTATPERIPIGLQCKIENICLKIGWASSPYQVEKYLISAFGLYRHLRLSHMPHTLQIEPPIAGFATASMLPGAKGWIQTLGFHTSDEGEEFTKILEALNPYLAGSATKPSQVDHALVVFDPSKSATVYVNELEFIGKIQAKGPIQAGQLIWADDIVDLTEVNFGVNIPPECSFMFLFSSGWRKAFFFDFRQTGIDPSPREFDPYVAFAAYFCLLTFHERFSLTQDQWDKMIGAGCFPFVGLKNQTATELIRHCKEGWNLARLVPQMIEECKELAPKFASFCDRSAVFRPHAAVIKAAAERFVANDSLSAAHLLYPRIEGVLTSYHLRKLQTRPKQDRIIKTAMDGGMVGRHSYCLVLIEQLHLYLQRVIFADFDFHGPSGVSRHTIGHGVVDTNQCDERSVAIAFLSLHHLYYCLGPL